MYFVTKNYLSNCLIALWDENKKCYSLINDTYRSEKVPGHKTYLIYQPFYLHAAWSLDADIYGVCLSTTPLKHSRNVNIVPTAERRQPHTMKASHQNKTPVVPRVMNMILIVPKIMFPRQQRKIMYIWNRVIHHLQLNWLPICYS
jgi:hypothetical protein